MIGKKKHDCCRQGFLTAFFLLSGLDFDWPKTVRSCRHEISPDGGVSGENHLSCRVVLDGIFLTFGRQEFFSLISCQFLAIRKKVCSGSARVVDGVASGVQVLQQQRHQGTRATMQLGLAEYRGHTLTLVRVH